MAGVSKEQIERAKAMPLLDYLLSHEGDNFKRVGNAYYRRDPDHNSLEVSNNLWHWHSHGIGGNIIDYLIKINGYSFVDAVRHLAGDDCSASYTIPKAWPIPPKARPPTAPLEPTAANNPPERSQFNLPPRNCDNNRAIAYLESRGIDKSLILDAIRRGCLYETAIHHNACFVGRDESGKARFAALRGTVGSFKRDADGSDKKFGFCLPPNERGCKTAIVFESPIDALSHMALFPDVDGYRLSLGGTALSALTRFLDVHKEITNITVCTDNDASGNACADKIAEAWDVSAIRELPKQGKDWNEFLQITQKSEVKEMEDVRKEIVFRDSGHKPLFTVKDGDSIKITVAYNGEELICKCRWIDEAHTKIGSEYYHNDEFSEKAAKVGNRYEAVPNPRPKIDVLAAKYGEDLQAVEIPMTEAAVRKLVGGNYTMETLYNWDKKYIFGALVRGKDGIAVCGIGGGNNDTLTSLHPYHAQTYKRELSPATPPQPRKVSLLDELEATQKEVAATNAAKAPGDKPRKRDERS
ncbi:MAG: toprim domain-containing protein [Oscillospiraceae bacterium]|jgi:hypothetical protein|nr:toprim domain-containing protein [Oscillospiraceae bacterium]